MRSMPASILGSDVMEGQWSDGRSSRLRTVKVSRNGDWLQADTGDAGESIHDWPLAYIRISPRLGRTPRTLTLPDGGCIELADSPTLDEWFPRPPSRVEAFADWLERRKYAIAASALITVALIVGFLQYGLPWAALKIAERLPASVERSASNQVVKVLERFHLQPTELPDARQQALQSQFKRLVAGEPRADQMRLNLVNAAGIGPNAFALPDGRIYMTDQLVELAESDDELLAVLAHEAGHHVHRHGVRGAIEGSSVFVLAGLMLGDATGSSLAVSIPATLLSNGFSRDHEREADQYAFALLKRHGKSPRDFATLMARLMKAHGMEDVDGSVIGYLSTHPPSQERVRAAEAADASR
ncbi:M48 family metallopeptidase [Solilutibacter tolerans]|uniref:Peptidase family M48 n=1 Tax=Solilutibacter tolerans TaxID=1604334 RepID=A0A1N6T8C8_9GAMM|nr:M48 family metallopeptidase [Lysobacter tolerans]SIQ49477.1 Peptidase family M48 [Lysobacter tolerans]